jgi:hypothetical protein
MAEETTTTEAPKKKGPKGEPKPKYSRKTLRKLGRAKRAQRLQADKEFAKGFFEARSKRSTEKKSAFRKKKQGKK